MRSLGLASGLCIRTVGLPSTAGPGLQGPSSSHAAPVEQGLAICPVPASEGKGAPEMGEVASSSQANHFLVYKPRPLAGDWDLPQPRTGR